MQSSQTAMSGGIGVVAPATVWLLTMRKLLSHMLSGLTSTTWIALIAASGGASTRRRRWNSSMRAVGPCTSRKTAPESLPTNPVSPSSLAIRWTNGRNPTPCTTPVTVNRWRTSTDCTSVSVISTTRRLLEGSGFRRIVAAPAHQLQTGHRLLGAGPVGLLDDETHVNDHPVTGCKRFLRQHADIDLALLSGDVDQCELPVIIVQHPDELARYAQTHRSALPFYRCRR